MHKHLEKYISKLTQRKYVFTICVCWANFTKLYEMNNSGLLQTYREM